MNTHNGGVVKKRRNTAEESEFIDSRHHGDLRNPSWSEEEDFRSVVVRVSKIFHLMRLRHGLDYQSITDSVEGCVNTILTENQTWTGLSMDFVPTVGDEIEGKIFSTIISDRRWETLYVMPHTSGASLCSLLEQILPVMKHLEHIALLCNPMSDADAESVFGQIKASSLSGLLFFTSADSNPSCGVVNALVKCLQGTSPIRDFSLVCCEDEAISEETFLSICSAFPNCPFLERIHIISRLSIQDANVEKVTNALSATVLGSSSLTMLDVSSSTTLSTESILRTLSRSLAVQNFDLMITQGEGFLGFVHPCWWKPILPMNLWPLILKKANMYRESATHEPVDILYFLVKEKFSVLLQNVKKRRVRKRKRCAIDA